VSLCAEHLAMAAQDDAREREMRTLFNLVRAPEAGRSDVDALLELKGPAVPQQLRGTHVSFELKSATSGRANISTVRDFGLHHIEKWRELHWLFGIYGRDASGDQTLQYCLYGSPTKMKPWFDSVAAYIAPDVALATHVPHLITDKTVTAVLGTSQRFSREDAKDLMKKQLGAEEYDARSDLKGGEYSRKAMLEMLRERCAYIIQRGSTLNNPHISASHFDNWEQIVEDHAARLRELVIEALLHS
jgi:hypothetical protein